MRRILLRVLAAIPAVALQALWLVVLIRWLAPWAAVLNFVLSVLALLFVLYLITKQEEPTYKVLWLLVILSFPLPGALLYLMFGGKRTTRSLRARLDKIGGGFSPGTALGAPRGGRPAGPDLPVSGIHHRGGPLPQCRGEILPPGG